MNDNHVRQGKVRGNPHDTLLGVERRERIRELLAQGLSKPKIAGELDITTTALYKHLRKIEREDEEAKREAKSA